MVGSKNKPRLLEALKKAPIFLLTSDRCIQKESSIYVKDRTLMASNIIRSHFTSRLLITILIPRVYLLDISRFFRNKKWANFDSLLTDVSRMECESETRWSSLSVAAGKVEFSGVSAACAISNLVASNKAVASESIRAEFFSGLGLTSAAAETFSRIRSSASLKRFDQKVSDSVATSLKHFRTSVLKNRRLRITKNAEQN